MEKRSSIGAFFDTLVIIAIFLVLIQTFIEDFAVIAGWSWQIRRILIFTGCGFDLFFVIEFLSRLFIAVSRGNGRRYLFIERGWIDFLASVPLLILNSGPTTLSLVLGGGAFLGVAGFLNVLKVVKAVRIARILRLLRVLKIVKQLKYADSRMAQRHVSRVTTIGISVIVFSLFAFSIIAPFTKLPAVDQEAFARQDRTTKQIVDQLDSGNMNTAHYLLENAEGLLVLKKDDTTLYSRFSNPFYKTFFGPGDYRYLTDGGYIFFYDIRYIERHQSMTNLLFFIIVVIFVIMFILLYSPHFALTVSDPLHVMKRGFQESSYNLEVRIPDDYRDDDIFELAEKYNEVYLPMKDRNKLEEGGDMVEMKLDDFDDLFDHND